MDDPLLIAVWIAWLLALGNCADRHNINIQWLKNQKPIEWHSG